MKVLVTGANGFAGSHVLDSVREQEGLEVIAACRDGRKLSADFRGEVREGDLRDDGYVQKLVKGVDVVCHAAAWSSLWGHAEDSERLYLKPTLNLMEEAKKAGVRRFINTSSTSAASPDKSADAMNPGIMRPLWPHLCNVIRIENRLRELAATSFQAVNLRLGIFAGSRYSLGVLPVLVPRLKTHLVPWVAGGSTSMPIVDGRDIGRAFALACKADGLADYDSFNIVGPEVPSVRQVVTFLREEYGLPRPHFSVPFAIAYPFAWLMEKLDPVVPWEPLVTRSIIHLLEEVNADNTMAKQKLGYSPTIHWQEAIRAQMVEMAVRESTPMSMVRPIG